MMNRTTTLLASLVLAASAGFAHAASHSAMPGVEAMDQDVSAGMVLATKVMAPADGWLVIHRTDAGMKPGPVVGHAPLKMGENVDVSATLDEDVKPGEMLMLMVHGEEGGMKAGEFEYYLGAKEDGPIRIDDKLVMTVITAK